jgi:putative Holliday junction resolvase
MAFSLRASPIVLNSARPGVILAIDYGQKRLGLALSDECGVTSRPFAIWTRINRRRDLTRLRDLIRQHAVRRIVVGLPLRLDGTPSEMSEEAKGFAARVEKALGIPVEMMDERLSSWEAEQTVVANKSTASSHRRRKQREGSDRPTTLDNVAAAVILRDYLDRTRPQPGRRS